MMDAMLIQPCMAMTTGGTVIVSHKYAQGTFRRLSSKVFAVPNDEIDVPSTSSLQWYIPHVCTQGCLPRPSRQERDPPTDVT